MMIPLLNISESGGIWDAVIKIATPLNLAAFALAVVLFIVLKSRRTKVPPAVWIVIVLLIAIPIGASVYSGYRPARQNQPAGDEPAELKLEK
jgi:hypothetical protein